ncbi:MAG TPA: alternative ribosome rescue aminoacyl-tRNA hydrolase ArfB [Acidimicrobiia bacterium]|nr:alternative ribosome rescue aminoacyl-tRNA hydrolase ArfB [Acidimicrobiia bacterium]
MGGNDHLDVGGVFTIPPGELTWRFSPSGGPGGQHANKASTRVELLWDVDTSNAVPEELRSRLLKRLGNRVRGGTVSVIVDDTRSQWQNRALARRRLAGLLVDALRTARTRRATRPTFASRKRRLEAKSRKAETKRLRQRPERE